MRRLLEHQKFKAAAGLLHEREQLRAAQWQRPDERVAALAGDDYEPELEVDLFSLAHRVSGRRRARQAPAEVLLPPEQMPVEGADRSAARSAVGNRGVRLRGVCSPTCRTAAG